MNKAQIIADNERAKNLVYRICPTHKNKVTFVRIGKYVYAEECGCMMFEGRLIIK